MTDLPPRRRGRPTKEEAAARAKAAQEAQSKKDEEASFLDTVLEKPVRRHAKLHPDEETLRTISELGKLFCTQNECAAVLGVTVRTLQNFFTDFPEARECWDDGLQFAKVSLRRKQLALADKNAPAAIFLGKNYLGQKDETTVNQNITNDVKKLTEEQLLEIASRSGRSDREEKKPTRH